MTATLQLRRLNWDMGLAVTVGRIVVGAEECHKIPPETAT
jgi:hypothetical protein